MSVNPMVQAFEALVGPPTEDTGCRLWQGPIDYFGYGRFRWEGRPLRAHRVAWEISNGPIPEGQVIRHGCDVRACQEHLLLGTQLENIQDMIDRKRHARGEKNGHATLVPSEIEEIRGLKGVLTQKAIGEIYGIHQATVSKIIRGDRWSHVRDGVQA